MSWQDGRQGGCDDGGICDDGSCSPSINMVFVEIDAPVVNVRPWPVGRDR